MRDTLTAAHGPGWPRTMCSPKLYGRSSPTFSLCFCVWGVKHPVRQRGTCVGAGHAHGTRASCSVCVAHVPKGRILVDSPDTGVQQDSNQVQDCDPPTHGEHWGATSPENPCRPVEPERTLKRGEEIANGRRSPATPHLTPGDFLH